MTTATTTPPAPSARSAASTSSTAAPTVPQMLLPILAETYALAVKTHGAHWNVTGSGFYELHERFSEQYEELYEAADELAERLRAIGAKAPAGLAEMAGLARGSTPAGSSDGAELLASLLQDHRRLSEVLCAGIRIAQSAGDEATADLLIGRVQAHDKTAWMLQATLG